MLRFTIYCCNYFLTQNMITLTIYFAGLAKINTGLIVSIWSITPFGYALFDKILFGFKLELNHYIGMVFILVCAVLLSLTSVIYPAPLPQIDHISEKPIPAVIPVIFGLLTPCIFTFFGMLQKHLISERGGGFDNT